jgi:hypothetical protein
MRRPARLLGAGDQVEVRDESGAVIGCFTKLTRVGEHLIEGQLPSNDELDRRSREGKRYSAVEVAERLRKLKEALG